MNKYNILHEIEELKNNKANIDLSNLSKEGLAKLGAEINGSSVTFAGGFVVQGGWVAAPYNGATVYFPKPMSSVWAVVAVDAANSSQNIETSVGEVTTTSFRVRNLGGHGVYWIAIGTK